MLNRHEQTERHPLNVVLALDIFRVLEHHEAAFRDARIQQAEQNPGSAVGVFKLRGESAHLPPPFMLPVSAHRSSSSATCFA